jgi:hypothetical protein
MEDQALSPSYDLAPAPSPSPLSSVSMLGKRGWGRSQSYGGGKAWSSTKYSILSGDCKKQWASSYLFPCNVQLVHGCIFFMYFLTLSKSAKGKLPPCHVSPCGGSCTYSRLNIFIRNMCLANYGASEAIYLCNVVEKIHQYFRPKMRQCF